MWKTTISGSGRKRSVAIGVAEDVALEDFGDFPAVAYYGTSRAIRRLKSGRPILGRIPRTYGYESCLDSTSDFDGLREWLAQVEWERNLPAF